MGKVSSLMKTKFHSEPFYGDKYTNTEIASYEDRIDTDFYGIGIPKKICSMYELIIDNVRVCY